MEDRRKLANGKEIWVIKAGFPNNASKKNWSDYFFACTLKKYLNRAGVYTVIESRDEWENEGAADVVVALRGTGSILSGQKGSGYHLHYVEFKPSGQSYGGRV